LTRASDDLRAGEIIMATQWYSVAVDAVSAIAALIAAGLWIWSAFIRVPYNQWANPGFQALIDTDSKTGKKYDVFASARVANRLSGRAAIAAAVAAAFQVVGAFV
jgi:hypothetical protein